MDPAKVSAVIELLCHIAQNDKIKAAFKHSTRGALLAGAAAFLGGIFAGPPGIAVGGAVGGVFGAWMSSGQFQPLPQIIMELPPCQKERLYDEVSNIISRLDWTDATELILIVMGNSSLKQMVAAALVKYVTQQLNAEVQYGD